MERGSVVGAVILGLLGASASAQPPPEPPALGLSLGARVRLQAQATPGTWVKGVLVGADAGTIALAPDGSPPFGASQVRLPRAAVTRLEVVTGRKRQWLPGVLIGAGVGVALGFAVDVDPDRCRFDDAYACSRGEAVALMGGFMGAAGAGVGALVRRDVWTPVDLDALSPPVAGDRLRPVIRASARGVALGVSIRF